MSKSPSKTFAFVIKNMRRNVEKMLEKLFKKTSKKADEVIDRAAEDIGDVVKDAGKLIVRVDEKINVVTTLLVVGICVRIIADVISIAAGLRKIGR